MDRAVERYEKNSCNWVTLSNKNAGGEKKGGARVCINDKGIITKGPKGLTRKSIKKLTGPQTNKDAALRDGAKRHGVRKSDLTEAIEQVHGMLTQQHAERERLKQTARKMLGITQRQAQQIQNAGRDYDSIKGFDDVAGELANMHPELGLDPRYPSDDLWDVLLEGAQPVPPKHSEEVIDEAAAMLADDKRRRRRSGPFQTSETESVPFSRRFNRVIQRYARQFNHRIAAYARGFDESKIKRDEGGQFADKAEEGAENEAEDAKADRLHDRRKKIDAAEGEIYDDLQREMWTAYQDALGPDANGIDIEDNAIERSLAAVGKAAGVETPQQAAALAMSHRGQQAGQVMNRLRDVVGRWEEMGLPGAAARMNRTLDRTEARIKSLVEKAKARVRSTEGDARRVRRTAERVDEALAERINGLFGDFNPLPGSVEDSKEFRRFLRDRAQASLKPPSTGTPKGETPIITGKPEQAKQLLGEIEAASQLRKSEFAAKMKQIGIPAHGSKSQMVKQAIDFVNRRAVGWVQTHS